MLTTDISIHELMIRQEQEIILHRCQHAWHWREYLARRRESKCHQRHERAGWPGAFDALGLALLKK